MPQGLPEPRVKRTVEGDLGMRHNAATLVDTVGIDRIALDARLDVERVRELVAVIAADAGRLPESAEELALDQALVRAAVTLRSRAIAARSRRSTPSRAR